MDEVIESLIDSIRQSQAKLDLELARVEAWRALQQLDAREAVGQPVSAIDVSKLRARLTAELAGNRHFIARGKLEEALQLLQSPDATVSNTTGATLPEAAADSVARAPTPAERASAPQFQPDQRADQRADRVLAAASAAQAAVAALSAAFAQGVPVSPALAQAAVPEQTAEQFAAPQAAMQVIAASQDGAADLPDAVSLDTLPLALAVAAAPLEMASEPEMAAPETVEAVLADPSVFEPVLPEAPIAGSSPASESDNTAPSASAGDFGASGQHEDGLALILPNETGSGAESVPALPAEPVVAVAVALHSRIPAPPPVAIAARKRLEAVVVPGDLEQLQGLDRATAARLTALGVMSHSDIARWSAAEIARIAPAIGGAKRIAQSGWIEQAAILARGEPTAYLRQRSNGRLAALAPILVPNLAPESISESIPEPVPELVPAVVLDQVSELAPDLGALAEAESDTSSATDARPVDLETDAMAASLASLASEGSELPLAPHGADPQQTAESLAAEFSPIGPSEIAVVDELGSTQQPTASVESADTAASAAGASLATAVNPDFMAALDARDGAVAEVPIENTAIAGAVEPIPTQSAHNVDAGAHGGLASGQIAEDQSDAEPTDEAIAVAAPQVVPEAVAVTAPVAITEADAVANPVDGAAPPAKDESVRPDPIPVQAPVQAERAPRRQDAQAAAAALVAAAMAKRSQRTAPPEPAPLAPAVEAATEAATDVAAQQPEPTPVPPSQTASTPRRAEDRSEGARPRFVVKPKRTASERLETASYADTEEKRDETFVDLDQVARGAGEAASGEAVRRIVIEETGDLLVPEGPTAASPASSNFAPVEIIDKSQASPKPELKRFVQAQLRPVGQGSEASVSIVRHGEANQPQSKTQVQSSARETSRNPSTVAAAPSQPTTQVLEVAQKEQRRPFASGAPALTEEKQAQAVSRDTLVKRFMRALKGDDD